MGANESNHAKGGTKKENKKDKKAANSSSKKIQSSVLIWGNGNNGQLGLTEKMQGTPSPLPIPTFNQVSIVSISCGTAHTAFLTSGGTVYMAGQGSLHRLGLGHDQDCWIPTINPFTEEYPVREVACGSTFTLFTTKQGGIVYSCGTAKKGALGLYDATTAKKPEKVSQISKIIKIACGNAHSVALASDGKVYSWGDPAEGALGHGELNYSEKLQARQGSPRLMDHNYISRCRFIDVAAGHTHTALLSDKGEVYCCGRGNEGQLGYGGKQEHWFPRKVDVKVLEEGQDVGNDSDEEQKELKYQKIFGVKVFCGLHSTAIISTDYEGFMWGDNILSPVQIICKDKILQIAPHAATGLILTELKEVHTYLPDEIDIADELVAKPMAMNGTPVCYIASNAQHFAVVKGDNLPDLKGDIQAVVSYNAEIKLGKQFTNTRTELFKSTEKRQGSIFDDNISTVSGTSSVDKMKAELFSKGSKPAVSNDAPVVLTSIGQDEEFDNLDDFKASLFGKKSNPSVAQPQQKAPRAAENTEAARNDLFAPKKAATNNKIDLKAKEAPEEDRNALFAPSKKSQAAANNKIDLKAKEAPEEDRNALFAPSKKSQAAANKKIDLKAKEAPEEDRNALFAPSKKAQAAANKKIDLKAKEAPEEDRNALFAPSKKAQAANNADLQEKKKKEEVPESKKEKSAHHTEPKEEYKRIPEKKEGTITVHEKKEPALEPDFDDFDFNRPSTYPVDNRFTETKEESSEEFVDELPPDSTIFEAPSMRPIHMTKDEEPVVEVVTEMDLVDDSDLL